MKKEIQFHVSQLQNRFHFCPFFVSKILYRHKQQTMKHMATWLGGPRKQGHTYENTQPYICHSPNGFLCDKVNYSCPPQSRGNISLCKGAASKFCFLWAALFLEHIYKQKLVCWQWISSLCDRTGLGLGRFCVLPVLTLAWEKLKLL